MLKAPDFGPQIEGKSSVCADNGEYHAYLDRNAAIGLLYDLYWLARSQSSGEEVSISSDQQNEMPMRGKRIGYCEFNYPQTAARQDLVTLQEGADVEVLGVLLRRPYSTPGGQSA